MTAIDGATTIQGRLIAMRPISREDYPTFFRWRSTIETIHLLNFRRRIASYEEFVHEFEGMLPSSMILVACELRSLRPIGYVIAYNISPWDRWMAVGMYIEPPYRATGHGGEATLLSIDAVFRQFPVHKIVTEVYDFASSLLAMMRTVGFEDAGYLPDHYWYEGQAWGLRSMTLSRDNWLVTRERLGDLVAVQDQFARMRTLSVKEGANGH